MTSFFNALRLLTIFPLPQKYARSLPNLSGIGRYFPLIGLLMGLALFAVGWLSMLVWSRRAAAALIVVAWAIFSGGLHLDGLADIAEGWGDREERVDPKKNPRRNGFGAVAVSAAFLLKFSLVSEIELPVFFPVLVSVPVAARAMLVSCAFLFPAARKEGTGAVFKRGIFKEDLLISALLGLGTLFALNGPSGPVLGAVGVLCAFAAAVVLSRLLGGLRGSSYGALCELSEIALLAAFTAGQDYILFPVTSFFR